MSIGSIGSAALSSLSQTAEQSPERGIKMLKKALDGEKEQVQQLLESIGGKLDIKA